MMHRLSSLFTRTFIAFGVFGFGIAGPNSSSAAPITLEKLEASVNSGLILQSDLQKFRDTLELRAQLDPLFAGTDIANHGAKAPRSEIVDFLINEKLITTLFSVTDTEVEQAINNIQTTNRLDREALKKALREQGFSFDDYFNLIRISVAKKNLIERDIRTKVNISEDDVKNHFINHVSKNVSHRAYKLRLITVSTANYKSPGAAREVIDRALKEIRAGEAFEDVAKRMSDDATAPQGGDLGTLTEDQISPMFKQQLKSMQIGQVSDTFGQPGTAYFLLKLVDIASGDEDRYIKVKDEIREQLAAGEYQRQIQLWLERHRQNAYIRKAGESTSFTQAK